MPRRASLSILATLVWLAGCATPALDRERPLNSWIQRGAGSSAALRAIVPSGANCPLAMIDGMARPMQVRAQATPASLPGMHKPDNAAAGNSDNPAFNPDFAVVSCELTLPPSSASEVSINGRRLPLPKAGTRRIVVLGDTGCRIKVPANGKSDPIQDCANPQAWPWAKIAAAAARTQPDLVIHVGDYHYREYCDDPKRCRPLLEKGMVVSYGWAGWNADFFTPAAPLLATAPWVFVRGNHENCDRGGEGWMRFLSPLPYRACANQRYKSASRSQLSNNFTADAYRIDLDEHLALAIVDNSGHEDYRAASETPEDVDLFRQTLAALRETPPTQQLWLFSHKPIWYDLLGPTSQPNALQKTLRQAPPNNLQIAFAGHQHAFATINFASDADPDYSPSGRPAQAIVGGSGTQLESLDPQSPFYEGVTGIGSQERVQPDERLYDGVAATSGIVLNRYSFLLLERDAAGLAGTVMDSDGLPIARCRLNGNNKALACQFPEHREHREHAASDAVVKLQDIDKGLPAPQNGSLSP